MTTQNIKEFIINHIDKHPSDISKLTMAKFGITRQAVNKHIHQLVKEKLITIKGNTRNKIYALKVLKTWKAQYRINAQLQEDIVWRQDIEPRFTGLAQNVMNIWHYGFTEMFNNAIDHANAATIMVQIKMDAVSTEMTITDDGVGIFKKIQASLNLIDENNAVLELVKGKLTTDPKRHSGEGIFFTSRIFDTYRIISGSVEFKHRYTNPEDWIIQPDHDTKGTVICMKLNNLTKRTSKDIFDQYANDEEYRFDKTCIPVKLARYGDENLISRSQAKRLVARVEKFKTVIFDFADIDEIGQAFADEIFRVFAQAHPTIKLDAINTSSAVKKMISRARLH